MVQMRNDLSHLPAAKQRDLDRVLAILFDEFEDAIGTGTKDWKKKGRILKVVLAAPVEGDYEKSSRAVCGAAELIYAFISDLDGEELQPFTETGFASYFVKIVADANIRIDVRIAARLALEKLMSVETVLDEVRAQEEVIDGLVRMMLKLNKNEQERLNKDVINFAYSCLICF